MNKCRTCSHTKREEIDQLLRARDLQTWNKISLNVIAQRYGLSKSSVLRHRQSGHHLKTASEPENTEKTGNKVHRGYNAELVTEPLHNDKIKPIVINPPQEEGTEPARITRNNGKEGSFTELRFARKGEYVPRYDYQPAENYDPLTWGLK